MVALRQAVADVADGVGVAAVTAATPAARDHRHAQTRDADRHRLYRRLADVARRQNSILRQAKTATPTIRSPASSGPPTTIWTPNAHRPVRLATLGADPTASARPDAAEADLIDALPYLTAHLCAAPEALLRRLFEVPSSPCALPTAQLRNHQHPATRRHMPHIAGTIEAISQTINEPSTAAPNKAMAGAYADAVRAPGKIRTCAPASGDRYNPDHARLWGLCSERCFRPDTPGCGPVGWALMAV